MSLGAIWVLCDDGLLHEDPILSDAVDGKWFVCFDEDDPPELVLQGRGWSPHEATKVLAKAGISARIVSKGHQSNRARLPFCRGSAEPFVLLPSTSFDLQISVPPPARLIVSAGEAAPIPSTSSDWTGTAELFGRKWR